MCIRDSPGRPENSGSTLRKKAVKEQKIEKVEKIYKIVIEDVYKRQMVKRHS